MIWFTADFHLGHAAIIGYTDRPYKSAGEMDSALMANALSVLRPTDVMYVLGDFAFADGVFRAARAALESACVAHFIRGNHDAKQAAKDCPLALDFKHNRKRWSLCHYPWATWRPNTVMLHGHTHGNPVPLPSDSRQRWRYDVGVDTDWSRWGGRPYYPVSIEMVEARTNGD